MEDKQNQVKNFNKEQVYANEIFPLICEIKSICGLNEIPFFCSCAVANENNKTEYRHDGVLTGSLEVDLYDNRFENLLLVLQGAKLKPLGSISEEDEEFAKYISEFNLDYEELYDNDTLVEEVKETKVKNDTPVEKKKRGRPRKVNNVDTLGDI